VEALEHLDGVDVVVTDFNFGPGNINGNEFIRLARQKRPELRFIMASGTLPQTTAAEITIEKPYDTPDVLFPAIMRLRNREE
jgi:hypothetical protein